MTGGPAPVFACSDVTIWQADARTAWRWLPERSVDAIVTSPPYYGLRDYGVDGQLGLEASPEAYVEGLADLLTSWGTTILKSGGSLWLNLGDTYATHSGWHHDPDATSTLQGASQSQRRLGATSALAATRNARSADGTGGFAAQCLLMIPERVALALIARGWILRNKVVWAKPNAMPSSVQDRLATRWEHLFHLVRAPRYGYDLDAVRDPLSHPEAADGSRVFGGRRKAATAAPAPPPGPPASRPGAPSPARPASPLPAGSSAPPAPIATTPTPTTRPAATPATTGSPTGPPTDSCHRPPRRCRRRPVRRVGHHRGHGPPPRPPRAAGRAQPRLLRPRRPPPGPRRPPPRGSRVTPPRHTSAQTPTRGWRLSYRADPAARAIADRHYTRRSVGAAQFVPPGRCLVLLADQALWVTSWPYPAYVRHAWPGAWVCCLFRNEGPALSSTLIRDAVAATRWRWPAVPERGMVTFVDAAKVRPKRDPGRCFLRAGFRPCGTTKTGLVALRLAPPDMPAVRPPAGAQQPLPPTDRPGTLNVAQAASR